MDSNKLKEAIAKVVTDGYDAWDVLSHLGDDAQTADDRRALVQELESAIKSIAGKPEEWDADRWSAKEIDALHILATERSKALDLMVRPTPAEVKRLEHQNDVLMRRSLDLLATRNEFNLYYKYDEKKDDNQNLDAELFYDGCKNGEWHHMDEDEYYGSDFGYMLSLQAVLAKRKSSYQDVGGVMRSELMDNGRDFSEGRFLVRPEYAHISFCYALSSLCTDIGLTYSVPDVLRMDGFTSRVSFEVTEEAGEETDTKE